MEAVILAAGAGRRFGARKQFVPVTPDGATLLEVTLRDARAAGCSRAVVVSAPGQESEVLALFDTRPVDGLDVAVVPQRLDELPVPAPPGRDRPWGTAHALWCARAAVRGPFLLFNADDYYGPNGPATLLAASSREDGHACALLGYPLETTLAPTGTVSRAVCSTDGAGRLAGLREYPAIDAGGRVASGPETGRELPLDAPVSMNAWALDRVVFEHLDAFLSTFLATADLERDECYLPAAIDAAVRAGELVVHLVPAPDRWCGMTWPEDHDRLIRYLAGAAGR